MNVSSLVGILEGRRPCKARMAPHYTMHRRTRFCRHALASLGATLSIKRNDNDPLKA
jgi:hypothetical protein